MAARGPAGSAKTGARFLYSLVRGPFVIAKNHVENGLVTGDSVLAGLPDFRAFSGRWLGSANNLTLVRRVIC